MTEWVERVERRIGNLKAALGTRYPLMVRATGLIKRHGVVDRAAALAMYSMLAAVPSLLAVFSVTGFLLGAVDRAGDVTGLDLELKHAVLRQMIRWVREALPGVTWNPADFAAALVRHRTAHGVVGLLAAAFLGLTVFGRIDDAIRDLFGRPRRSTIRAAGYMGGVVGLVVVLAVVVNFSAPLLEWGLHVAAGSVSTLSLGWLDGVALALALAQSLPVAATFFMLVRWSVRGVSKRHLLTTAAFFGLSWTLGQWLFTLYVKSVVKMDALYGALSSVIALLLWLFYANLAFLITVAVVAAREERRGGPPSDLDPGYVADAPEDDAGAPEGRAATEATPLAPESEGEPRSPVLDSAACE